MGFRAYKLVLGGVRRDIIASSLARAKETARVIGGDVWLGATQVTSGTFEVDLAQAIIYNAFTVTGVVDFTASADKGIYQYSMIAVVADGTNAPTFTGFTKWGGSLDYDNTAAKVNHIMFFSDGDTAYYSIVPAV